MHVTIELDERLARSLEREAGRRNVSVEQLAAEILHRSHTGDVQLENESGENAPHEEEAWSDEKNTRRCDLIDKDIQGIISPSERHELDHLQAQLRRHLDRIAPLDFDTARNIHRQLLQKKQASESGK